MSDSESDFFGLSDEDFSDAEKRKKRLKKKNKPIEKV